MDDFRELVEMLVGVLETVETPADAPGPGEPRVLKVPYHNQWEADAQERRMDCGPAAVEMVCEYWRPDVTDVTTDEIMRLITGGAERGTGIGELQTAAQELYGVTLERHDGMTWEGLVGALELGWPVIALVHYGSCRIRMDRGYTRGHYVVAVGTDEVDYQGQVVERVVVHDPDFYGGLHAQGAFLPLTRVHFEEMWEDCVKDRNPPRMGLMARRVEVEVEVGV